MQEVGVQEAMHSGKSRGLHELKKLGTVISKLVFHSHTDDALKELSGWQLYNFCRLYIVWLILFLLDCQ